jgi:uncharacterized protein (TIGR03792 family)
MVIEWLIFHVPHTEQAHFIAQDKLIWTPALARNDGFLGKEIWRDVTVPDRINLIIRWSSMTQWKAVPQDLLSKTDQAFQAAMGMVFPVLGCVAYDVLEQATDNS